jgi:hypothetical protein
MKWSYQTDGAIWSSPCVTDVEGDGSLEILVGSHDYKLYCLSSSGDSKWNYTTTGFVQSSPCVVDVDADGKQEVLFGSYDDWMYCVDVSWAGTSDFRWTSLCFSGNLNRTGCFVDTDEEGLSDDFEVCAGTNPALIDTDGDTYSDYWEFTNCSNPLDDLFPPTWEQTPTDQVVDFGLDFHYDLNATDPSGIDTYWLNVTTHFTIDDQGIITNTIALDIGDYGLQVSVNDTLGYILTATFTVTVIQTTTLPPPIPGFHGVAILLGVVTALGLSIRQRHQSGKTEKHQRISTGEEYTNLSTARSFSFLAPFFFTNPMVEAKSCPECEASYIRAAKSPKSSGESTRRLPGRKSPARAAALSIIPGAGLIYATEYCWGIWCFVSFFVIMILGIPMTLMQGIAAPLAFVVCCAIVMYIASFFLAPLEARKYNRRKGYV